MKRQRNEALDELIRRVILPYTCVGWYCLALGLMVRYSPLPEINTEQESPELATANAGKKNIFQFPHLILGAVAIFLHVGTQVIAIDTIIGYANSMHINLMEAKVFPSYTLFATICGYIIGIICIPQFYKSGKRFKDMYLIGNNLYILIIFANGQVNFLGHSADISIWFVVLFGFCKFYGVGRYLAIGTGWIRTIYKTGRLDNDHGLMWQCHIATFLWLDGRSV